MKNISFLLFSFSIVLVQAQDKVFFNSNQSLVNLNPSFAGSNGFIRHHTSGRAPITEFQKYNYSSLNCFDAFIKPLKAGIAVFVGREHYYNGDSTIFYRLQARTTNFGAVYAQHLSFNGGDLKIIPSVQFSYIHHLHNYGEPLSPLFGKPPETEDPLIVDSWRYFSLGSGLLVNYKKSLYAGMSVFNLNQPYYEKYTIERLPIRYVVHAAYTREINTSNFLQFSGRYSLQGNSKFLQLGTNVLFLKHFVAGVGFRSYNRTPLYIDLGYRTTCFSILATYSIGNITNYAELHLSYNLRNKENRHPTSLLSFESW